MGLHQRQPRQVLAMGPTVMVGAFLYTLRPMTGFATHFCQHQARFYVTDRSVVGKELDFVIRETRVDLPIPSCVTLGRLIDLSRPRFPYLYNEGDKINLM